MKTIRNVGLLMLLLTLLARAIVGFIYPELPWWIPLVSVPLYIISTVLYLFGAIFDGFRP